MANGKMHKKTEKCRTFMCITFYKKRTDVLVQIMKMHFCRKKTKKELTFKMSKIYEN